MFVILFDILFHYISIQYHNFDIYLHAQPFEIAILVQLVFHILAT